MYTTIELPMLKLIRLMDTGRLNDETLKVIDEQLIGYKLLKQKHEL